jgi:hypothetical protein
MRRLSLPFALLVASLASASASAEPRTLFGRPVAERRVLSADEIAARRQAFEDNLAARGLMRDGDRIVPDPEAAHSAAPDLRAPRSVQHGGTTWEDPPHYATIYLNFFGGTLTSGTNAAEMQSGCVGAMDVDYPAYAGSEMQALTMIQVFQNAMAPYAVRIAYEEPPPAHLPYSMVMMGGDPTDIGMDPGTLGVSCSSDCGDFWWRDTTFAFTEASSSALTLGNTALQEAAHAFGLDHIDGSDNIMYPFATSGAKVWTTECTPYNDATGGISCTYVHDAFCGEDAGMQNDHAELLAYFGPNEPDVMAPVVELLQPEDGLQIDAGGSVTVEVSVTDDHEGAGWRLRVVPEGGDEQIVNAYQFEPSWNLAGLPEGTYEIIVEAIDHDGNEGSDAVTIVVGDGGPVATSGPTDDGDGTGAVADDTAGDGPDDSEGGGDGTTGPSLEEPTSPTGCECGTTTPSAGAVGWLAIVPLLRRRRRSR